MSDNIENEKVTCQACEGENPKKDFFLQPHLERVHDMSLEEYREKWPNAKVVGQKVMDTFRKRAPERKGTERYEGKVKVGDIVMNQAERKPNRTFNRPPNFRYPQKGKASEAVERLSRAIKYGRHVFLYGPAGTGKSASVRALGHDLKREASHYPMREGLDPELFLGKESVVVDEATDQSVTTFVEGSLLRDLRGRKDDDGNRHGVLILIDDIDRAPPEYHEVLRHILEQNASSIFLPQIRQTVDVHPDTQIVATANSLGQGDRTGHYASVHRMDESIKDRFERAIEMHFMEKEEERKVLKSKFPEIEEVRGEILDDVAEVSATIREMIAEDEIHATFSHRRSVQWMKSIRELHEEKGDYEGIVRDGAKGWMDWYDDTTQEILLNRILEILTHTPS